MSITLKCVCGKDLQVRLDQAGTSVRCPSCGNVVRVPAMGIAENGPRPRPALVGRIANPSYKLSEETVLPRRGKWPGLVAGIGLALLAGATTAAIFISNSGAKTKRESDVPLVQADEPARNSSPTQTNITTETISPKAAISETFPTPVDPPPREKVKEKPKKVPPPPNPPSVAIDEFAPARPRSGDTLTIHLTSKDADGKPCDIEFRTSGDADWKKSEQGVVKVAKLAGPALMLEFRAVDKRGLPSPVLAKTWKIEPLNLVGQPLKLEWKLKEKDRFFQELRVVQKPVYNIQGIPFTTLLEYVVVSSFQVQKAGPNGLEVRQKVESARLIQADPLTQPLLAPAVLKLPGTTFTIHLDDKMDVKKFEANGLSGVAMAQGGLGLQVASLLDQDGWKEMARMTFFQPNRPLKAGEKWSQPMTHAWGSLGRWSGRIHYAYGGGKGDLHQFAYGLELKHQPPKAGAAGLGVTILNAAFQVQQAGGSIVFDAERGKVTEAREQFSVRGRLALQLLGQNTPVELQEEQSFHLRIVEVNPEK